MSECLYDADYVLVEDHEGNLGICVFHSKEGFIRLASNALGKIIKWERIYISPQGFAYRQDGSLITNEEIYGEEDS